MNSTNHTDERSFEHRRAEAEAKLRDAEYAMLEAETRLLKTTTRWRPVLVGGILLIVSVAIGVLLSS